MAQNYGFCGPRYLPELMEMAESAKRAFGRRHHRESARLLNYKIYGFLDSGNLADCHDLLNEYLKLGSACGLEDWLHDAAGQLDDPAHRDVYKAAVAVRVAAESNQIPSAPVIDSILARAYNGHGHPRQLICLNLGRILLTMDRMKEAEKIFRHSLNLCLQGGDTMQPMGLLPLAYLHDTGLAGKRETKKAEEIAGWLRQTQHLDRTHFAEILDHRDGRMILERTFERKNQLFPFSYR